MNDDKKKEEIIKALTTVEYHPVLKEKKPNTQKYMKLPLGELSAFGVGLSSLPASFRTVTGTLVNNNDNLWRMFTLPGASGQLQMKNGVTLGTFTENGLFSARARFVPAGESISKTTSVMPFNPTMLFMAAVLMSVEQKLGAIEDGVKDILDFLQVDKRTKLQGSLSYLSDILNNYKFNWDNQTYKTNMHIKVQDIKQEAEQNTLFYRDRIKKELKKRNFLKVEQKAKKQLSKVQSDMEDYQLAVYLYGFSSLLEVLLLGNFDEGYLKSISDKVNDISIQYREMYTESYEIIEANLHSSIESNLLKGVAIAADAAGKTIAKIPIIGDTQIDETLIAGGEGLDRFGKKRTQDTVQRLSDSRSSRVTPFISCINTINTLYNQKTDILFDRENIYLGLGVEDDESETDLTKQEKI